MADVRFSRQSKISWWDQRKIHQTTAMVVGCGGIGTWTVLQLGMLGVTRLVLVDPDTVDESNLNRQLYWESEVGVHKVTSLAGKVRQLHPQAQVMVHMANVQDLPSQVYDGITVVFDCLDNIPTREYLDGVCAKRKIVFVHSACSDVMGEVQLIIPGVNKGLRSYPASMRDDERRRSCKDFDPAVCTTNMIVASLQVDAFLDYLFGKDVSKPNRLYLRGMGITYG